MLIDRGVAVALGTDLNPGGGVCTVHAVCTVARVLRDGMTLEALIGATLNAAWSIDRSDTVGSLEPGKLMDAVIVEAIQPTSCVLVRRR